MTLNRCLAILSPVAFCAALSAAPDPGTLRPIPRDGHPAAPCPLKHTDVQASITGFVARVTVVQDFQNPLAESIEAVYTFPLPPRSAVDNMTITVGDRVIHAVIERREQAQALYDAARQSGRTAALLDQQRPNIFTQSIANIKPGAAVKVALSYVEILPYEAGNYEFVFPTVVGPRYSPKGLPDAHAISPPVTPETTRAGHDLSLSVILDAGVPIDNLQSPAHEVTIERPNNHQAKVSLTDKATIPNKDFILRYDVAGRKIEDAVLTHASDKGKFFTLIVQPPERVAPAEATPKELVFVLDTSGSMMGFPIEKAKEVVRLALAAMNPRDTFNLITFSGDTHILFPQPVPATPENVRRAQELLDSRHGGGGTEMMKAIRAALDPSDAQDHVRVVAFLTDGYVGNDMEIIAEVQKHANARVFAFGIGGAVNRFLLDKMAEYGRGEVEYVGLRDDGSKAAQRFFERVRNPLLTGLSLDWGGLPVSDVFPTRLPDLFSAKPVVIHGRYTSPATGVLKIRGKGPKGPVELSLKVTLPAAEPRNDSLASVWARTKIDDLMGRFYTQIQNGQPPVETKEEIVKLGLAFRLVTQYTSFVAVDEQAPAGGGRPRRIVVPLEMPEGVTYEGVFGKQSAAQAANAPTTARGTSGSFGGFLPGHVRRPESAPLPEVRPTSPPPPPAQKLSADLQSLLAKWKAGHLPPRKLDIQLMVISTSPAVLEQLRQAGFEILSPSSASRILVGRIAIDRLEALTALDAVRSVLAR